MPIIDLANYSTISAVPRGSVIVLGFFDGVHIGHLSLFEEAKRISNEIDGAPMCVWTFDSKGPRRGLTTTREKCLLLKNYGIDFVIHESFDEIRDLDGDSFFREHIAAAHSPAAVVCGFNFTFGKNAAWSAADLYSFANNNGIYCSVVPEKKLGERTVSSTEIRRLVEVGQIENANALLGHPYSITSVIEHGAEIGRKMGVRTINQRLDPDKVIPGNGVYCCTVEFESDGKQVTYGGICNIGSRPTVNDRPDDVTVETHIFDFDGDVYGSRVTTKLYRKLRDERKFSSIDSLRAQIEQDAIAARELLKEILK